MSVEEDQIKPHKSIRIRAEEDDSDYERNSKMTFTPLADLERERALIQSPADVNSWEQWEASKEFRPPLFGPGSITLYELNPLNPPPEEAPKEHVEGPPHRATIGTWHEGFVRGFERHVNME